MRSQSLQQVVGAHVRRIRRERGLSQEELAHEIGLHRTFVGAVERGERNLTLQTVERIAAGLGVAATDLLLEPRDR